jgi:hypothetical protein
VVRVAGKELSMNTVRVLVCAAFVLVQQIAFAQDWRPVTAGGQECGIHNQAHVRESSAKGYYDHSASAENQCGQMIKLKACRVNTVHCSLLEIAGNSKLKIPIGTRFNEPSLELEWTYVK